MTKKRVQPFISDVLKVDNIIGKSCFYRKIYSTEIKESTVHSAKEVINILGESEVIITLADGHVSDGKNCYFSNSETA